MRRSLLLYLFVFAVLIGVVQYVTAKRMLESKNEEIENLESELALTNKKNDSLYSEYRSSRIFSLETNEEAISYLEQRGFKASEVAQRVEDQIISGNKVSADNDLVPYEGMEGQMRINKIRILNHKWVIADFTDGTFWGELFITYEIDDENNLILKTENSLLYPQP